MLWYRGDFSELPIEGVLSQLGADERRPRLTLPEGSTSISAWIKPIAHHPQAELWFAVHDHVAFPSQIKLGADDPQRLAAHDRRDTRVRTPARNPPRPTGRRALVPVRTRNARRAPRGRHPRHYRADGSTHVLEDFEGDLHWTPIIAADISSDRFAITADGRPRRAAVGRPRLRKRHRPGLPRLLQQPQPRRNAR